MADRRNSLVQFVKSQLSEGHERSIRVKRNILVSFVCRSVGLALGFVLVPVMLGYLNPVRYGIWLTLVSIVGWFGFVDLGLGNGLRNRFAEALARDDRQLARIYVSTSYALLAAVVLGVYAIFLALRPFLDWQRILKAPTGLTDDLGAVVGIVFTFFLLQILIRLIGTMLIAEQKSAVNDILDTTGVLIAWVVVVALSRTTEASLTYLAWGVGSSYVVVYGVVSLVLFRGRYRSFTPSLAHVNFSYARDLSGLGVRFFLLQVSGVVIFSTDNIIITRLFGSSFVPPYMVSMKYFGLLSAVFSVLLFPFWSAYTEAFQKGDYDWIRIIVRKITGVWALLSAGAVVMLGVSGIAYKLWIGDALRIPFCLSALMAMFTIISMWNAIFAYFVNGVGKIRLQVYSNVTGGLINIPLSIFFARFFGVSGVILATIVCIFPASVLLPIQYRKIIGGRAGGIWNA